jgi:type I site-specific restriction endonuclease
MGQGFTRRPPKRVGYLLRYTRDFPLAVVEAKAAYRSAADGLQQAKQYAEMLGLEFVDSTNRNDISAFASDMGLKTSKRRHLTSLSTFQQRPMALRNFPVTLGMRL